MRYWAIAFSLLALLSALACLGANTHDTLSFARVLMVVFGALGAYAAASHALARSRHRPRRGGPIEL